MARALSKGVDGLRPHREHRSKRGRNNKHTEMRIWQKMKKRIEKRNYKFEQKSMNDKELSIAKKAVTIDENFRLRTDTLNYWIERKRFTKEGEEAWVDLGYYEKLEHACEEYLNESTRSEDGTRTIQDLIATIQIAEKNIIKAINSL